MEEYAKGFEKEVLQRLTKIETKVEHISEAKSIAYEANRRSMQNEKDVQEIKESSQWLKRALIVAIVTAVTSMLVGFIEVSFK